MLELARSHQDGIARRIGWKNTEFQNGLIQDLALDRDKLGAFLAEHPVRNLADLAALEAETQRLRKEEPMNPDGSIDLVLSNCVLNLIDNADKQKLFREIHRVLKRGGRCAISDIVSDQDVPEELRGSAELWSGCISGAMREDRFLQAFSDAGLYGVEIVAYQEKAWAIVEGVEFRSMTVVAQKGKEGACYEHNEAVIYKGPWKQVIDDDGHVFRRGERSAVCRKTFGIMRSEPYAPSMLPIPPLAEIATEDAGLFTCSTTRRRDPQETKTGVIRENVAPGCDDESCC
jgi:SAM-dependent methyltransferase